MPVWVGPASAVAVDLPIYELHGTPRGHTLAVFAIEDHGRIARVAVDIGNDEAAGRWARSWRWGGEWEDGGIVRFEGTVRLFLAGDLVTTLSTIDPKEDLTPHEWSTLFRLQMTRMPLSGEAPPSS
jgi:hypothetical protein